MRNSVFLALFSLFFLNLTAQSNLQLPDVDPEFLAENYLETASSVICEDAYRRTYTMENGRVVTQTAREPINIKDQNGNWIPLRTTVNQSATGFFCINQPYPLHLDSDGSFTIKKAPVPDVGFPIHTDFRGLKVKTSSAFGFANFNNPVLETVNSVVFSSENPGMKKRLTTRRLGVKSDYLIENPSFWHHNNFSLIEHFESQDADKIIPHPDMQGVLSVRDAQNREISRIYPLELIDANGAKHFQQFQATKIAKGQFELSSSLSADWLTSPQRTYPVVIDPLITGPTETYAGGIMPSCLVPNFYADSILVTIPAQITITGVFVSGNYYASPFGGATMGDGRMYFQTSCGRTNDLTVTGPNASLAGWAQVDDFNFRDPLSCCFGQSCTTRTFWLSKHIGRTVGPNTCNSSQLYYDPLHTFQFSCFVEGRTVETAGLVWTTNPVQICADQCELTFRPFVRYGVPPYTVTHPWATAPFQMGNPQVNCAIMISSEDGTLTRPNCPAFCGNAGNENIPVPTVTDMCGNTAAGFQPRTVFVNPVPVVEVTPDPFIVCNGVPGSFSFSSCVGNSSFTWNSNGNSGSGAGIDSTFFFEGQGTDTVKFSIVATANGCSSPPFLFNLEVHPTPQAVIDAPEAVLLLEPFLAKDSTDYFGGNGEEWSWDMGDGSAPLTEQDVTHSYSNPGEYSICLTITSAAGCIDTVCRDIIVLPLEIELPNVITPNGDGLNDALEIPYLPFYGQSHITVLNRWGVVVYNNSNYQNDWIPQNLTDGTYFYVLSLPDGQRYSSTLNIFSK
jgi:gliding motility-associated-like protein